MPLPHPCRISAPANINVYSDGSWKHPLVYYFSIGGAGVWWPGRTRRLCMAEEDLSLGSVSDKGVRLRTAIGGFAGSSTRTELAAGILAICSNAPMHLGSDSKAFVDKANVYIDMINKGKRPRLKWALVPDGDLWEHFFKALEVKGTIAVKITWVKGHATDEHVAFA